ncbi:glutaredoxin [Halalkaliarchaeum desulfuricum]|uniref:Glutaredoxin n=1 Tax=Halalkaliarchaeum desulfuricum TaxID=2055893 RepID=A0A343TNS9_9EURY|nr:thioredoxin family protein [Halalkaliarchaeum desulfuricum]AUX10751.1 glutaredoxin [Halalkaliarchaeum desulfuricum]
MSLLTDENKRQIGELLERMDEPVTIHTFTDDCETCEECLEFNREMAETSELLSVEEHEFDGEAAEEYGATKYDHGPVQVLEGGDVSGVNYFGLPTGQEINSYITDIVELSTGDPDLSVDLIEAVQEIDEPVEITVFVTPTCPHCPGAVQTAHRFAMVNEHVTGEMIQSQEFMEVAQEYGVRGVPQINVNGSDGEFTGNLPPQQFLSEVKNAL